MARLRNRNIAVLLFIVSSLSIYILLKKSDSHSSTKELSVVDLSDKEIDHHKRLIQLTTQTEPINNNPRQYKASKNEASLGSLPPKKPPKIKIPPTKKAQDLNQEDKTTFFQSNVGCGWLTEPVPQPPFLISAVLLIRIYETDKANLTSREMLQWLQYLRYAGIEHVYVYDAWVHEGESQEAVLGALINKGFVTYIDWHKYNPYTIQGTQVAAYQHCIDHYRSETTWQTAIDIDEYPFAPKDTEPGFFYRYVQNIKKLLGEDVSEVTMHNFLYLGKPLNKEFLIDRVRRRTPNPSNNLVKPIYIPHNLKSQVHHNILKKGRTTNASPEKLRMNHYWGARLQNWGEDTPEILDMTIPDYSIQPIVAALTECKHLFLD